MSQENNLPSIPARHLTTEAAHAGEITGNTRRALTLPIYQTTTYAFDNIEEVEKAMTKGGDDWFYYRFASPNQAAFEAAIARLEGAEATTTAGSGMGAVFLALSAVLKSGDHIIADEKVYSGTYTLLTQQLPRFGIETTFVNITDPLAIRAAQRATTRLLYFEVLSNPLLQVTDLAATVTLARDLRLLTYVDSTFTPPTICRPLQWGVDLVIHATTKYISGHSDALGGVVAGRRDLVEAAHTAGINMGVTQSPFDAWLNTRSLKTLPLRMTAHSHNAQTVAEWFAKQPKIKRTIYPGLPSHPQHELARKYMPDGLFGGILSFELDGGRAAASKFCQALREIPVVPSLADTITTIIYPAGTSHRTMSPQTRAAVGVTDGLLRLSVGLEDPTDTIADLEQALKNL